MQVLIASVYERQFFELLLCLPTASALPIEGTEISVRRRFWAVLGQVTLAQFFKWALPA